MVHIVVSLSEYLVQTTHIFHDPCTLWCRLPCCCVLRTHSSCLRYLCYALPACLQSRPSKQRKQSLSYHKNNKPSGNRRIQSINIPTVKTRDKTFDSVQLILIKIYTILRLHDRKFILKKEPNHKS